MRDVSLFLVSVDGICSFEPKKHKLIRATEVESTFCRSDQSIHGISSQHSVTESDTFTFTFT